MSTPLAGIKRGLMEIAFCYASVYSPLNEKLFRDKGL